MTTAVAVVSWRGAVVHDRLHHGAFGMRLSVSALALDRGPKRCCDDSGGALNQSTSFLPTGALVRAGKRSFLSASTTSWQWPRRGRAISSDCDIGGECAEDASDFDRR
jgi:hypothetical protein